MFNNPKKQKPADEKTTQETSQSKWKGDAKTSYTRMFQMMGTPKPVEKPTLPDSDTPKQTIETEQPAPAENPKNMPAKIKK